MTCLNGQEQTYLDDMHALGDVWYTNDGRALRVVEMTDLHLWHARQYLVRRLHNKDYQCEGCQDDWGSSAIYECACAEDVAHDKVWILRFEAEFVRRANAKIRVPEVQP